MTTAHDPTFDTDLLPADGETRSFLATSARRVTVGRFALHTEPPASIGVGPARMWLIYDTLADWQLETTRTFDPPLRVTAEYSEQDGWHVTEMSR